MNPKPTAKEIKVKEPELKEISTSLLKGPPNPMREKVTPESVEDLAASIREVGVIEPLIVRKVGKHFEVIAGERRLAGARLAKLAKVPCLIRKAGDSDADILKLHENLYREAVDPISEGLFFLSLKERYGIANEQIAGKIHKSVSYVRDRVAILDYPEDVREALKGKEIVLAVAKELAAIDDPLTRKDYLSHAVKSGVTSTVAAQWRRDYKVRQTYQQANGGKHAPPPAALESPKSAITCFLCQGEVDLGFSRTLYAHPECLTKFESGSR